MELLFKPIHILKYPLETTFIMYHRYNVIYRLVLTETMMHYKTIIKKIG